MSTPKPPILIASCSLDAPTWQPVADAILARGHKVITFEADKVALGTAHFLISIDPTSGFYAQYENMPLDPQHIGAAWFRRTSFVSDSTAEIQTQLDLDAERRLLQSALWDTIADNKWLNAPRLMRHANQKITQLILAKEIGFEIPNTIITNYWPPIHHIPSDDIIYKASRPLFYSDNTLNALFTTPFHNTKNDLPADNNPFPGIWQPLLQKEREWRVTVVGNDIFDAAIYTANDAKDDWRLHQHDPEKVTFKHEVFPDEQKEKCLQYLGKLGLCFGAFDFVENSEGTITFLECNPNGQFRWIEDSLGHPISQAIASKLINIARSSSEP